MEVGLNHLAISCFEGTKVAAAETIGVDANQVTSVEYLACRLGSVADEHPLATLVWWWKGIGKVIPVGGPRVLLMHLE